VFAHIHQKYQKKKKITSSGKFGKKKENPRQTIPPRVIPPQGYVKFLITKIMNETE